MATDGATDDISIHLPIIQVSWQQGILNAFDVKEIKKILLNKSHHHLISSALIRFVDSLEQIQINNDHEEKKGNNTEDDTMDEMNVEQEIKQFQSAIRPLIQQSIQLSYSSTQSTHKQTHITYHDILDKLMDNSIISKDILYLIEHSILSKTNHTMRSIRFNDDSVLSLGDCYTFVCCSGEHNMDMRIVSMFESVLNDEISIYKECMESLNDEINIIKSIFSTEHEQIVVYAETYPILIELCLSSTNNIGKLHITFLCPIDYPLKSPIKSSIYFCGPSTFATQNQIWIELQLKLQEITTNSIGEQHLFDIIQCAKEWIEGFEEKYNQRHTHTHKVEYMELRTALGLVNETNTTMNGKDNKEREKTYVWYIKDRDNNWCELPKDMQTKINNLSTKHGVLSYSSNNYDYIITKVSQAKAIQTNCSTNTQREIKRKKRKVQHIEEDIQKKQKQQEQIKMIQCYSGWQIDEIIRKLIKTMSIKWQCSKPITKQRLIQSRWSYDDVSDKQHNMDDIEHNVEDIALVFPVMEDFQCPVCLELHSLFNGMRIECQHIICFECLSNYILNQINNGVICIECPEFECKSLLNDCIIAVLSDNITYKRYRQFLQNSFLETGKEWSFCPNPSCDSAISMKGGAPSIPLLVCNCSIPLCTLCVSKFHWPLKCRDSKQWAHKTKTKIKLTDPNLPNLPQFEGQKYEMLVETKKCPRCKTPWEKNGGCNHILCRKCQYHFCWVCLKEFNQTTHDDFYECKQGVIASLEKNTVTMEEPTKRYLNAYREILDQRKQIREQHQHKIEVNAVMKLRTKRAIQHERASIFLEQKYLKKPKRLKMLLKNITTSTQNNKEKIKKQLNITFMHQLISRMIQTHLLLSRGYKYISYHENKPNHTISCILESLEHVVFKLDTMFQEPKMYLPYEQCRWKWYDLGFYIEFFISEMMKICNPVKERNHKPKKVNPFMKVSNHQY